MSTAAMIFIACQSDIPTPESVADCQIDSEKRIAWSDWDPSTQILAPSVFSYEACGKRLVYVAAEHSNDPSSATYAAVADAVADTPGHVLIEGFPAAGGDSSEQLLGMAEQVAGTPGDNEALHVARLAHAAGIPVRGAEPLDADVLAYARSEGLDEADMIGFYMLRYLPQMIRSGQIDGPADPRLGPTVEQLAPYFAAQSGLQPDAVAAIDTLPEFAAWYETTNGLTFDAGFRVEDAYPANAVTDPRRSNTFSDIISDARDAFIIQQLNDSLSTHDHVVIVYGASHHSVQAPALEAAFGTPQRIR